jgi:fructuronate reductase
MAHATRLDPALADWVAGEVQFPSSVVDRMVPAPTISDLARVRERLGLVDQGAVTTEPYRSWIMTAVDGMPPLDDIGVQFVVDVAPYEERKLRLLNGPHSALAYTGLAAGCRTIAHATAQPLIAAFVSRVVDDIVEVASGSVLDNMDKFAKKVLIRFANPSLDHTCVKVAADGSDKLPERYEAVIAARLRSGLSTTRFSIVVALWLTAAVGLPLGSTRMPAVEDPAATRLTEIAKDGSLRDLVEAAVGRWTDPVFQDEIVHSLISVQERGIGVLEGVR